MLVTKQQEMTDCLLLAMGFLEKADKLGADTIQLRDGIEREIEQHAIVAANIRR